ncbi:MAG TPA: hypothetical protein VFU73_03675 [Actinocrinis sp.]|nr:hypothetical protein [Actinocrinis sp.]
MIRLLYGRLRAEAAAAFGPPWLALRARGPAAFPLALGCAGLVALFGAIQHTGPGWWFVEHVADVFQELPLGVILLRLPLSMFAPAPDLPAWGAALQVLVVFGVCEVRLGRARTLVTALCVNSLTTLAAWVMIVVGLHLGVGTPQVDAYELDTGPSTVVVALSVYAALACRAYLLLGATVASMAAEATAQPNLAGREHLVALALGALAFAIGERIRPSGAPRVPEPRGTPGPAGLRRDGAYEHAGSTDAASTHRANWNTVFVFKNGIFKNSAFKNTVLKNRAYKHTACRNAARGMGARGMGAREAFGGPAPSGPTGGSPPPPGAGAARRRPGFRP